MYLNVGVYQLMGRRLPYWGSFGQKMLPHKNVLTAVGAQPQLYVSGADHTESFRVPERVLGGAARPAGFQRGSSGGSRGLLRSASAQAVLFLLRLLPDSLPPPTPDSQPRSLPEPTPSFGREAPPPAPFPQPQSLFATKGSEELAAKREGAGAGAGARGEAGRPAGGHGAEEQSTGILPGPGQAAMLRIAPAEEGAGPGGRR